MPDTKKKNVMTASAKGARTSSRKSKTTSSPVPIPTPAGISPATVKCVPNKNGHLSTERLLPNDEKVYPRVKYVMDGQVVQNEFPGTVRRLKLIYEVQEIRYYDKAGRADAAGLNIHASSNKMLPFDHGWKSATKK